MPNSILSPRPQRFNRVTLSSEPDPSVSRVLVKRKQEGWEERNTEPHADSRAAP